MDEIHTHDWRITDSAVTPLMQIFTVICRGCGLRREVHGAQALDTLMHAERFPSSRRSSSSTELKK